MGHRRLAVLAGSLLVTVIASSSAEEIYVSPIFVPVRNNSAKTSVSDLTVSHQLEDVSLSAVEGQSQLDVDDKSSGAGGGNGAPKDEDEDVVDLEDDEQDGNGTKAVPSVRRGYARLAFNNCGEEEDPLYITGFDVEPNPVQIPGSLAVGISFRLNENLTSPISVQLEMQKKLTFLFGLSTWFTIPCLPNGVGSCGYEDICKIGLFSQDVCLDPGTDEEIPCKCPFYEGDWKMKPSKFNVPELPDDFPNYLLQGEFFIKATIFKEQEQISCYSTNVEVNI